MPDSKQQFFCCTRKQIAILRCPQCKHLLGYCSTCLTLFRDLQDLSATMVKNPDVAIGCPTCQYNYPKVGWEKHLAVRRDLVEVGLASLASEDLQLSAVSREDDPLEKYRHSLNRVGWNSSNSKVDFTDESKAQADQAARKRLAVLLLLFFVLLGAGTYYYLFLNTPPPPPPPPKKPATKPVKR